MSSCCGSSQLLLPVIGDKAHQPLNFHFPQRGFGKESAAKRSFQRQWFQRWAWLHYDEDRDLAFCFTCVVAYKNNHLHSVRCLEKTFISTGFSNWKDAVSKFAKHEGSQCHRDSVLKTVALPATTRDAGEMLSSQLARDRLQRRKCLLKLLSNARFLARQGLAFRGDKDESDSNFMRLIQLRSEDNAMLVDWIKQKTDKYTCGDMQNEMVKVMALRVLREIAASIQSAPFFTVMVDETTDVSNMEQVVVCLRWVSKTFKVYEEFVGLYDVASTRAETIYAAITDVLLRMNLSVSKVRGQCYDGAATMSGVKSGVVARLCAAEPRAVYTHCYGHSLNLACSDTIKRCKLMQDALDTTHEITKLIKKSPTREAIFKKLKEEMQITNSPGIRILCPTRWTVRAESLKSILDNYSVLLELWAKSLECVKDTEIKARIQGVASQMINFDYFFGISLGLLVLRHTDNLSRTMQKVDMSAAEGQRVTGMTVSTLRSMRNDAGFDQFWQKTTASAENLDVNEPVLPRRRKTPRRLDDGSAPTVHATVEAHYRVIYFEALDLITSCIENRFDQPGYKTYKKVQELLMKAAAAKSYEEELQFVLSFYGSDFDSILLPTHLELFSDNFPSNGDLILSDVLNFFQGCTAGQLELMSQVTKLLKLLLVMPATNAESERSFSALRRLKSYLRSTMSQQRLNHLMLLHVHKSHTDSLNLLEVANDFITGHDHRKDVFGTEFKVSDFQF